MIENLINEYVKNKQEYKTGLTMDDLCNDYVPVDKQGDICKLNENENLLGTSGKAIEAMKEAAVSCNYYPEGTGKALREKLAKRYGLTPQNYMITEGANVALNIIGETFIQPGDEVIVPTVTYGAYKNLTRRYQGTIKTVPVRKDFSIDLKAVQETITEQTKLIFICNPNNPTGMYLKSEEILAFLQKVPENVIVVIDEAYFQFCDCYDEKSMLSLIQEKNCHTIFVRTFSKVYGMAGVRIGYAISSIEIIRALCGLVNYFCASKLALAGAVAALGDIPFEEKVIGLITKERERLTTELRNRGYMVCTSQSNFIFVDFGVEPKKLCRELEKYGVFLRGDFACTRISIGLPEHNQKLLDVLPEVMESFK